jgi:SAM-dependent methyltransferase
VLTWPAPERNKEPILRVLRPALPARGRVLEIASGTGQHVAHFAAATPQLTWLPSDPERRHRESIQARIEASGLANIASPLDLDVRVRPWPIGHAEAMVCINMIHIAPWQATLALLDEGAKLLPAGGLLYLYGPFRRQGRHTAPSNEAFDADLKRQDPAWGVRNLEDVAAEAATRGFSLQDVVPMPANNLSVLFRAGAGAPAGNASPTQAGGAVAGRGGGGR